MKSIKQIQNEMLAEARFDGGYPRAVLLPIGVIALARTEDEFRQLCKYRDILMYGLLLGVVAISVGTIAALVWVCLHRA
jgi:hypothetical protein